MKANCRALWHSNSEVFEWDINIMKAALFALALFFLFAFPASAANIEKIHFFIDLAELRENITVLLFSQQKTDSFVFSLPIKPENIEATTEYDVIENNGYKLLVKKEIRPNTTAEFSISFSAQNLVNKIDGNEYLFSFSYNAPSDIKDFMVSIALSEESAIVDKGGLLVSRPVSLFTDGKRIFLEWSKPLAAGEQFTAFVQYRIKPEQNESLITVLLVVFLLGGLILGYKIKQFRKTKFIKEVVSDDERKIIDEIMKKGELLQEELREKTDFSKTKISKLVRSLEQKGIIKKIPYKKTNKLKIK